MIWLILIVLVNEGRASSAVTSAIGSSDPYSVALKAFEITLPSIRRYPQSRARSEGTGSGIFWVFQLRAIARHDISNSEGLFPISSRTLRDQNGARAHG